MDETRRKRPSRRWLLSGLGLVAAAGLSVGLIQAVTPSARGDDGPAPSGRGLTSSNETCPPSAGRPAYVTYDLGSAFAGLPLADRSQLCQPAVPSAGASDTNDGDDQSDSAGPRSAVPFSSVIYGDCQASSDMGCAPPLEIQSWPECRRDRVSYDDAGADDVNARQDTTFGQGPDPLPGASFDDGTRLELYTGTTTIVVFADDPDLAQQAANTLAAQVQADGPRLQSNRLDAEADARSPSCAGDDGR